MDMKNAGTLQFVGIQTLNARRRDECLHFALECLDQLCLPVRIQFRKHIIQKHRIFTDLFLYQLDFSQFQR